MNEIDYSPYNNKCYLDLSEENEVFLYRIIATEDKLGMQCYEVRPNRILIYDDFNLEGDIDCFLPDKDPDFCKAQEITEEQFDVIREKIIRLQLLQADFFREIKSFTQNCK